MRDVEDRRAMAATILSLTAEVQRLKFWNERLAAENADLRAKLRGKS